ncbi:hypothetical protein [Micromonospora sp. NBC_01813]|uniref:hypothetical protein n=1 Tax=Micromonospora sp. NBC_01813 TaxID=2975988 RepID=UPI002DD84AFF|nr:hypothetical protein [Micromonospora sp. NBC_01813]WSA11172.1 hypothetical protein OG958_10575 [Micromonospora sp. NBC_01813]
MAGDLKRTGWRQRGGRDPKVYALSVAGAVLVFLGLVPLDSLILVAVGVGLALAGWLVARRTG